MAANWVNAVAQFTIQQTGGGLQIMGAASIAAEGGPYCVTVDPSGRYVYSANSNSSSISQYTITAGGPSEGMLASMSTATVPAVNNPRSVAVDPSGRFVYVANFGGQSISM